MTELWTAVDGYLDGIFVPEDPVLEAALRASEEAGLPAISISPGQGRLLHLLARMQRARAILEIGTLGGYSAICLARALPAGGRLITLESEPKHADVARRNVARAGLGDVVEVRVGAALRTLPRLEAEGAGPFDLVFLDADKEGYPDYLAWAIRLAAPGCLIVADNVVREGRVTDPASADASVQGVRRFLEACAKDPRLVCAAFQTVGVKGHDGFALARVEGRWPEGW